MPHGFLTRPLAALAVACGLGPSPGTAAEFSLSGSVPGQAPEYGHAITLSGELTRTDTDTLLALLDDAPDGARVLLQLDAVTGTLDVVLPFAREIHARGLLPYLPPGRHCGGACALLFIAGSRGRVMSVDATLAFKGARDIARTEARDIAEVRDALVHHALAGHMPASLATAVLRMPEGSDVPIETVDHAGLWGIALAGAGSLPIFRRDLDAPEAEPLARHCTNLIHWVNDIPADTGVRPLTLGPDFAFQGLEEGCTYHRDGSRIGFEVWSDDRAHGDVLMWQTLSPDTRLADISPDQLAGVPLGPDPFTDPPEQLVEGDCSDGMLWQGGWEGLDWGRATGFARHVPCDGGAPLVALHCHHGADRILLRVGIAAFDATNPEALGFQVDSQVPLRIGGGLGPDGKTFIAPLPRDYYVFEHLMAGKRLRLTLGEETRVLHLGGTRKTFESMSASCLE